MKIKQKIFFKTFEFVSKSRLAHYYQLKNDERPLPPPVITIGGENAVEADFGSNPHQARCTAKGFGPGPQRLRDQSRVCHHHHGVAAQADAVHIAVGALPGL